MLFNSYSFIVIFLPVAVVVFFFLSKAKLTTGSRIWLILVSLFFYGWWNAADLRIIAGSILVNFAAGVMLAKIKTSRMKKIILLSGIAVNLSTLAYYKYYNFIISNINSIADLHLKLVAMSLPLGISFFTFTQIAFLVDAYRNQVQEYDFINYALFVTFFPHLLAGPIIHHKEMMPQFDRLRSKIINYDNLSRGLLLFAIGLFKKVMIADSFAVWANAGFNNPSALNFLESWATSLSYSLQLYYDFSGYTDMAIEQPCFSTSGCQPTLTAPTGQAYPGLLETMADNVQPISEGIHVHSPWRQPAFRRENTVKFAGYFSAWRTWHGAGWTFLVWGALHGLAIIVHRLWLKYGLALNNVVGWFITFNFVNITWIFFRAIVSPMLFPF